MNVRPVAADGRRQGSKAACRRSCLIICMARHGMAWHRVASRRRALRTDVVLSVPPIRTIVLIPLGLYLLLVQLFTSTCRWANVRQTEQKISRII